MYCFMGSMFNANLGHIPSGKSSSMHYIESKHTQNKKTGIPKLCINLDGPRLLQAYFRLGQIEMVVKALTLTYWLQ